MPRPASDNDDDDGTQWTWDPAHNAYHHSASDTYARPQDNGDWHYLSAADVAASTRSPRASRTAADREDGEVDDDVGWGGLMSPSELARATKASGGELGPTLARDADGSETPYQSGDAHVDTDQVLRLVVCESTVLTPGDVVLVDSREGGVQIGRDRCERGGPARLRIKEMEASKTHAVVYWGRGDTGADGQDEHWAWWIVDLGSTTGTFHAPPGTARARLSASKHSSLPSALSHMSRLTIGHTTLEVHLHNAWPCEACQLADNEIVLDSGTTHVESRADVIIDTTDLVLDPHGRKTVREMKRKRAMDALKETLLGASSGPTSAASTPEPARYVDRSAQRRRLHPASPPPAAPRGQQSEALRVAAPPQGPSAAARSMLAGQGWTPGAALGKDGNGLTAALDPQRRTERRGLGAQGSLAPKEDAGNWMDRAKQRRWDDARQA